MSEAAFTHVEPLRPINNDAGQGLFTLGQQYPIIETYQRGNHIVNGEPMYFAQTTLVVLNDRQERTYIPYTSGNFTKKRGAVQAAVV